jgi:transcription initiation factor TFIID subunit 3
MLEGRCEKVLRKVRYNAATPRQSQLPDPDACERASSNFQFSHSFSNHLVRTPSLHDRTMSSQLNTSLLRAPILQILRAQGFHSTRPSVLDTLVNLTERYLLLLAETTRNHALLNHNDAVPTVTDVRMALTDCGTLCPVLTAAEQDWLEKFRRPLSDYDHLKHGDIRREGELRRREEQDTQDVGEFISWIVGDQNREIRRVAGVLPESGPGGTVNGEDYLTVLKKKHSKTGEESRFQGTVLGKAAENRAIKIEGGPAESLTEWNNLMHRHSADQLATTKDAADSPHEAEIDEQQLQMDIS